MRYQIKDKCKSFSNMPSMYHTTCKFGTVGRVRKLVLLLTFINFKTIEHFFVHCKICIPIWKEDERFTQKLEDYSVLFGIGLDLSEYKRVSV